MFADLSKLLDDATGVPGSVGYFVIIGVVVVGYLYTSASLFPPPAQPMPEEEEEEEPDPPRNFTQKQLRHFNGQKEESSSKVAATNTNDNDNLKPVYLSVAGQVFDVSRGRDFYGPGGPYELFAGRECGLAFARFSLDETDLDNLEATANLSFGEKTEMENWIQKFTYFRNYPIKGRYVPPSILEKAATQVWTKEELAKHAGLPTEEIPQGYGTQPILIGAGEKVYDVSFGGVSFYGPGGPYAKFAGKDASRALAKMSLDEADLVTADTSDLTEKQIKILNDWIKTFEERKGYPVVGTLKK